MRVRRDVGAVFSATAIARERNRDRGAVVDATRSSRFVHFGREEPEFSWEATDKALALAEAAGVEPTARVA